MIKKNTKNGKMIVCYPSLPGNGSKYTAVNLADQIKKMDSGARVGLLDLDLKSPYVAGYLSEHDQTHTIDNLIERIDGDFLDEEAVEDNLVELKNGVELLKGTKLKDSHHFIKQEHIRQIIQLFKRMFDVIVVATSHGGDAISTTVSMLSADHVVVVAKNDFSNFKSLQRELAFVKYYINDEESVSLVFNMFDEQSDLDFQTILSDEKVPLLAWVPFDTSTINNKNIDGGGRTGLFARLKKEDSPYDDLLSSFFPDNKKKNRGDEQVDEFN